MKKLILLLLLLSPKAYAQIGTTISVSGNQILGPCGDTLLLRGIDYAAYNWGWSPNELNINQIALSGANCVRIPWYVVAGNPTPQALYDDLVKLDSALSKCIQRKMIPILDLHDETCQNDPAEVIVLANWYIQPAVLTLIDKYKHSLILNIANEALYVNWAGNPAAAQTAFVNTYTTIANTLRNNAITVPMMIDGPDCGTNLTVLANVGATLEQNDPAHNMIFSAHAYWYAYAGNDSVQMRNLVNYALSQNIPFLFGEVANLQDDAVMCQYALNYKPLLHICQQNQIGWLAWSWDHDGCPTRQVTTAGQFNSLTTYGNDIVNNPTYGLYTHSPAKSEYLQHNGCGAVDTPNSILLGGIALYPNPASDYIHIESARPFDKITVVNSLGEVVFVGSGVTSINTSNFAQGIYFVQMVDEEWDRVVLKKFVKE